MDENAQWRAAIERANQVLAAGDPAHAAALLNQLPDGGAADASLQAEAAVLLQRSLLARAETADPHKQLALFFRAQKAFYRAVYINPHLAAAYHAQGRFWRMIGRPDMAARLLQSIQHSCPDDETGALLSAWEDAAQPPAPALPHMWPSAIPDPKPRILVITIPGYDPAMDVLYDGLCTLLGAENVVDYPYKPLLHGEMPEAADNYPTTCEQPGQPRSLEWICAKLREGYFDCILYADMLQSTPKDALLRLLQDAGDCPLYIVDGWDDASYNEPLMLAHMGRTRCHGYFKREMIAGVDYGPHAIPLPLSYPDSRIPQELPGFRTQALFWAGNRYYGLRRLYLEHLEILLNANLSTQYSQEQYVDALHTAHIGLCLFGFGFDTIRYYEVPAHGVMLLAEQPPIVIPNDFTDGHSALFFKTLPEMIEKVAYFFHHPELVPLIAANGRNHCIRFHTATARAAQLLAHVCGNNAPPPLA